MKFLCRYYCFSSLRNSQEEDEKALIKGGEKTGGLMRVLEKRGRCDLSVVCVVGRGLVSTVFRRNGVSN